MNGNGIRLIYVMLFVLILSGCASQPGYGPARGADIQPAIPVQLRGAAFPGGAVSDSMLQAAAEQGFNALFVTVSRTDSALHRSIKKSRDTGMAVHAVLDLSLRHRQIAGDLPEAMTALKSVLTDLMTVSGLDGIHVEGFPEILDRSVYTDLLDCLAAEILTVKPYLLFTAELRSEQHAASGIYWMERGIIDGIFVPPETDTEGLKKWNQRVFLRCRRIPEQGFPAGAGHLVDWAPAALPEYREPAAVPAGLKQARCTQAAVFALDSLAAVLPRKAVISFSSWKTEQTIDSRGYAGTVLPRQMPDSLDLRLGSRSWRLYTDLWRPPYTYRLAENGTVSRDLPWVEMRRGPADTTAAGSAHVLYKTAFPAAVRINGDSVKIYQTGIFFDHVQFTPGVNMLRAEARDDSGRTAVFETAVVFEPPQSAAQRQELWISLEAAKPQESRTLPPDESVRISFTGSRGKRARAVIHPGKKSIDLQRRNFRDYSVYEAQLPMSMLQPEKESRIECILEDADKSGRKSISRFLPAVLKARVPADFPLVTVTEGEALLRYNQGQIRLGGPLISESMAGAVLQTDGIIGDDYRVRLDGRHSGVIARSKVDVLPAGAVKPAYYIQSIHAAPGSGEDVVSIPYSEPVPYAVFPEPDLNRIRIALYGAKTTSTWITHKDSLSVIRRVSWQQSGPGTYEVLVHLNSPVIWGYKLQRSGAALRLGVKHPPVIETGPAGIHPAGLKVAIEAGHGGSNYGAQGLSGLLEKDINLDVALKLEKLCRQAGMEVTQARTDDRYMYLSEKRDIIEAADPDIMVSIHANAGSGRGGFLRVGGVSTYYHNPFWADYAELMYSRLRELPLDDYGVIGSFNYKVIRITSCPAILVEMAFMDHAEDEEKLASPEFRQKMAEKIFAGLMAAAAHYSGLQVNAAAE